MCIYGPAAFLSSCLSSNKHQWTISHNWREKATQNRGKAQSSLCFVAFRKHHRSHRVILIDCCESSAVAMSVTPFCIPLYSTWLKGGNLSSSLRCWESCAFSPFLFLWQRLGSAPPDSPLPRGRWSSFSSQIPIDQSGVLLSEIHHRMQSCDFPSHFLWSRVYFNFCFAIFSYDDEFNGVFLSQDQTNDKVILIKVCLKQKCTQVERLLSMKHSLKTFDARISPHGNSFVEISELKPQSFCCLWGRLYR